MPRQPNTSPQTLEVFQALLADPTQWRHGYDLSKQTGLRSGTLYPILIRLTDQGLLESRWEPPTHPGRPPRHAYRLTGQGVPTASASLAQAQATRRPTPAGLGRPAPEVS